MGKDMSEPVPPPFDLEHQRPLYEKLKPRAMMETWCHFWRKIPHRIWKFHIDSILVPSFRPEWGQYKVWSHKATLRPILSAKEKAINRELKKKLKEVEVEELVNYWKCHSNDCRILTFNVGGVRFQTQVRTVKEFPDSLLGDPNKRRRYYDKEKDEYFLDRHAGSFEAILHFFQTKGNMLNRPPNVALQIFEREIKFYELDPEVIDRLRREEGYYKEHVNSTPKNLFARKIWLLFEHPESSKQSKLVAFISIFVVIVSIFILCLETLEEFKLHGHQLEFNPRDSFFLTETVAVVWFIFELVARFCACHKKVKFLKNYMNIIDFIAILPYFLQLTAEIQLSQGQLDDVPAKGTRQKSNYFTVYILRVVRLVRILRIFKLSRHSRGLQVLGRTLHASLRELGLLFFFLTIGVILFSSSAYYAESLGEGNLFVSIPDGFFWAFTTMTTLGYGDIIPVTFLGKVIGSLCAIAGVLTLSLPVPVIVSNFNYFSHRDTNDQEEDDDGGPGQALHPHPHVKHEHVDACPYLPDCDELRKGLGGESRSDDLEMMYIVENEPLFTEKLKIKVRAPNSTASVEVLKIPE